jgi:type IV pilus assembly protein PilP
MRSTLFMVLGMSGALVALGCGESPPAAPVVPPAARASKKAEAPAPTPTASVPYAYNPVGKRDPFRSPLMEPGGGRQVEGTGETEVCSEPLCRFDLSELTVVAVVSGDANPLAMVEDKVGTGYLVRRNTKIGRQGGKVTQVLRDCIVVTSYITGPDGKAQPNKENMCVKEDARSAPVLDLLRGKDFQ